MAWLGSFYYSDFTKGSYVNYRYLILDFKICFNMLSIHFEPCSFMILKLKGTMWEHMHFFK